MNVYESGTGSYIPTLVLPVDETVRFRLISPDVIHSFWVTGFLLQDGRHPRAGQRLRGHAQPGR